LIEKFNLLASFTCSKKLHFPKRNLIVSGENRSAFVPPPLAGAIITSYSSASLINLSRLALPISGTSDGTIMILSHLDSHHLTACSRAPLRSFWPFSLSGWTPSSLEKWRTSSSALMTITSSKFFFRLFVTSFSMTFRRFSLSDGDSVGESLVFACANGETGMIP